MAEEPGPRPHQLSNDRAFWDLFEKGETIGRGHFAKVKLVRHKESQEFYAAKILDKRLEEHLEDYESMMREFQVLRSLDHPNIVSLIDAYETQDTLFLVCQLATGGELMHRIAEENSVYTEEEVKRHMKTILMTMKYMHDQGVVHRDLKPENILLSDKSDSAEILIADFGLGRFVQHNAQYMETVCGTHHYLAPELVKCDRGEVDGYGKAVDVWGIGLIAFIMLFGYNPFLRESNMATHEAIVTCKFNFPKDDNVGKHAKDLIKKMLQINPDKRITIDDALKHQWFPDNNDADNLRVGSTNVTSLMKEWNARRAVDRLTRMRKGTKDRRGSEDFGQCGQGVGPSMNDLNLEGRSEPSPGTKKNKKLSRRRSSNAADTILQIQESEKDA
mmetsp:Transcript_36885/g.61094  ORF Transcript_36885/g.61094 Transcript_36885/m.61094 type:complete len:388 (+) Transcript_36885:102-1265(+)|eukprot:CAMPEP_0119315050 /NCGR_PEP_ID=MMETSP1333-20130426/34278_1 /TAXON_ID=418940 /ORGANISM="Scyphosphaera apsteinii, Strain RCC1455" /LENGTH=387 /DNA_ID=CAMNT_0007320277 /DNA_START=100 /DNA_END=1263 /DNA_ORIENTATION=+